MGWDIIEDGIPVNLESLHEYFGLLAGGAKDLAFSDEGWIYHSESFFKIPGGLRINFFQFLKRRPWLGLGLIGLIGFRLGRFRKEKIAALLVELTVNPLRLGVQADMKQALEIIPHLKQKLREKPTGLNRAALQNEFSELTRFGKIFFKADLPIFLAKDYLGKTYEKWWNREQEIGKGNFNKPDFWHYASRLPENISLAHYADPEDLVFSRRTWDVYFAAGMESATKSGGSTRSGPITPPFARSIDEMAKTFG